MDKRGVRKILKNNLDVLEDMTKGMYTETMPNTCYYLLGNRMKLLRVIRNLLLFLYNRDSYINDDDGFSGSGDKSRNCYYFSDSRRFAYDISHTSISVAQGYRELLSAIGMLCRADRGKDLKLNQNQRNSIKMDTYLFEMWDDDKLKEFETNATRLRAAGVMKSNISSAYLLLHGLEDIKDRVLPLNNKDGVIEVKNQMWERLDAAITTLIDSQGYATNEQIASEMEIHQKPFDNLRRLFKDRITAKYNFHRPSVSEITQFGLSSLSYIYTLKTDVGNDTEE